MSERKHRSRQRRPELSQHFLRSNTASRLVQATSILKTDLVIEIGPGRGALTEPLLRRTSNLVAVEIDAYLANKLHLRFGETVNIVESDFLSFDLPDETYSIVGNIPYHKSTEIIRKIAFAPNPPLDAWLVVQSELARRMCGLPFSQETLWSLRLKPYWHLEIPDRIERKEFDPPPSVDSVLLHMSHRGRPIISEHEIQPYAGMIEAAFRSNLPILQALRPYLSKLQVRRLASDLRFRVDEMPAHLTFEQWLGIFRFWNKGNS